MGRIEEQQRKEKEISQRVQRLERVDLLWTVALLEETQKIDNPDQKTKSDFKTLMRVERQYFTLPIEMKVSTFSPEVLEDIELAYNGIKVQAELFNPVWPKYEGGEIDFKELKRRLNLQRIKDACVEASKSLPNK
jgi:hypothetical protein